MGYSLQKIEKILQVRQQLQQVKQDKAKHEQSQRLPAARTIEQLRYALQEAEDLGDKESFLTKTISILLKPEAGIDNQLPQELLKQQQQQKKKRQMHL